MYLFDQFPGHGWRTEETRKNQFEYWEAPYLNQLSDNNNLFSHSDFVLKY